jgi:hypothetical protein
MKGNCGCGGVSGVDLSTAPVGLTSVASQTVEPLHVVLHVSAVTKCKFGQMEFNRRQDVLQNCTPSTPHQTLHCD